MIYYVCALPLDLGCDSEIITLTDIDMAERLARTECVAVEVVEADSPLEAETTFVEHQ